jgi:hypothetical protein
MVSQIDTEEELDTHYIAMSLYILYIIDVYVLSILSV